jgi:hypothetical protein
MTEGLESVLEKISTITDPRRSFQRGLFGLLTRYN